MLAAGKAIISADPHSMDLFLIFSAIFLVVALIVTWVTVGFKAAVVNSLVVLGVLFAIISLMFLT
jgi:hypothetical protein